MGHREIHTIDDVRTWLASLPPASRVHLARLLANTTTAREMAAIADATVAELFASRTAADVAAELGLTVLQVRRAVREHRARTRSGPPTQTG